MTTYQKPRTIVVDEFWRVLVPECPVCGKTDKVELDDRIYISFTCSRCNHPLTLEETIDGQKEVEQ